MSSLKEASIGKDTNTDRRRFVTRSVAAAIGIVGAGLFVSSARAVTPALTFADIPGSGDIKTLNYALSLEDLEADLYAQATMRLTGGGTNALGTAITGLGLGKKEIDVRYVRQFGLVENQHRDFLRGAIVAAGGTAISPFKYDFGMQSLNRKGVMDLVYTAEKTGVSAYLGATPFISRTYLRTAVAIQGTEARHTAVIAAILNQLFSEGLNVAPLASENGGRDLALTPDQVLAAVSPFIVT
ncbi:MAG: ferritin-like domain-containing protein [Anaerolineae bacterium]|nr:ferritin-like domain-containing protein [Phycisphaerae bacterium]